MADRSSRERVLEAARGWIGTPYRHQASRKHVGCDCLGLVRGVWAEVYGEAPALTADYSADWAEVTKGDPLLEAARAHCAEIDMGEMRPGDLLVFRWRAGMAAKHLAILGEAGRIIHAYEGHAVAASAFVPAWRRRVAGVFAFPSIAGG